MIEWYAWIAAAAGLASGLFCVVAGLRGRPPGDLTVGSVAVVELLLIVQVVIALFAPAAGNPPLGDPLEFWMYLIVAIIIPPAAVFWGLIERSRWSTVIMGAAALTIAVMVFRMQQIWMGANPFIGAVA